MYKSEDPTTKALVEEHLLSGRTRPNAVVGTSQTQARYEAFAKAEAFLIEHALVIPYGISGGYTASYTDPFEGQYAPYGIASLRYKGQAHSGEAAVYRRVPGKNMSSGKKTVPHLPQTNLNHSNLNWATLVVLRRPASLS